jgi:hypothetical protein
LRQIGMASFCASRLAAAMFFLCSPGFVTTACALSASDFSVEVTDATVDGVNQIFPRPVVAITSIDALGGVSFDVRIDLTDAVTLGSLHIDILGHRVTMGDENIDLTPTEFRLLVELARRPQQVFTREMLLDRVWGYSYLGDSRLVDVAIQRLRAKLNEDGAAELIETVRGVGYRAGR